MCVYATACGGTGGSRESVVPKRAGSDFVGIVAENAMTDDAHKQARVLDDLRDAHVGLLRQPFRWREVESSPGHYDFSRLDALVSAAAERGIEVLPILFDPPPFRSSAPARGAARGTYPPRDPADMGRFAERLVHRYGPDGTLWKGGGAKLPIRAWQVWNEPNLAPYWPAGPDAAAYARLLRATARGIKNADPRAEVVSAGLAETQRGIPFRAFVTGMVRAGARSALDVFALHAFAGDDEGTLKAVEDTRRLLSDLHVRSPIWVTEFGWASGGPASPFTTDEAGQASRITGALAGFGRRRRELGIRGVVYYDWRDAGPYPGSGDFFGLHTGLLRADGRPKPALRAFEDGATVATH
jgi:hypothetical protein